MYECNRYIGYCLGCALFDGFCIKGRIIVCGANSASSFRLFRIDIPFNKISYSEIIFVVKQQLLKACPCNIYKFYFSFCRSSGRCRALCNVLPSATGCLHHLVNSPIPFLQMRMGKIISNVVDTLRLLEGNKLSIVALLRQECVGHGLMSWG